MGHLGLRKSLRDAGLPLEQSLSHIAAEIDVLLVDMSGLVWLCLLRHIDLLGWLAVEDPVGGLTNEGNVPARAGLESFLTEVGGRGGRSGHGLMGRQVGGSDHGPVGRWEDTCG